MARYPGAVWRPLPEEETQPKLDSVTQIIWHSAVGLGSLSRYFGREDVKVESQFWVSKTGLIEQYLDSDRRGDAALTANVRAISIETADDGDPDTDPWTEAQLQALEELTAWLCQTHDIPGVKIPEHDKPGIGWHTMFGAPGPWTNVRGKTCPGVIRKTQCPDLLDRVAERLAGKPRPKPPPLPPLGGTVELAKLVAAAKANPPAPNTAVTYSNTAIVEKALAREGLLDNLRVDGHFGTATITAYSAWQRRLGYSGDDADGVPGQASLVALANKHGFTVIIAVPPAPKPKPKPKPPAPKPVVDLRLLVAAAKGDPRRPDQRVTYAGTGTVEMALVQERLLEARFADGHFGTTTVAAYAAWQRHLGYRGDDADGIPGKTSLAKLGAKYSFTVTESKAPLPPPPKPSVSLPTIVSAARSGSKAAGVETVQKALKTEVGLDYSSGPGFFGPKTKAAYAKWQRKLGYSGSDADGIPGIASLRKLGMRRGFNVTGSTAGAATSTRVSSPVPGRRVTYAYGVRNRRYAAGYHTGNDYAAPSGTPVVAVRSGTIIWSNNNGRAYGRWIGLRADNGRDYVYCHLSVRSVVRGTKVRAGQVLGKVGATGNVTGPHLHFEDRARGGGYGNVRKPSW